MATSSPFIQLREGGGGKESLFYSIACWFGELRGRSGRDLRKAQVCSTVRRMRDSIRILYIYVYTYVYVCMYRLDCVRLCYLVVLRPRCVTLIVRRRMSKLHIATLSRYLTTRDSRFLRIASTCIRVSILVHFDPIDARATRPFIGPREFP